MKNLIKTIAMAIIVAFLTFSFITIKGKKKEINIASSKIVWKGYKLAKTHEGVISFKSGYLKFDKNELIGGEFIVDMTSITNTDLEGAYKGKLEGHLKSDDFFGVENYPTATFKLTKASPFKNGTATVTGVLTIKGQSEDISFEVNEKQGVLLAQVKVDRAKYNVRYGSNSFFDNLGDKAIDDIFILDIEIDF